MLKVVRFLNETQQKPPAGMGNIFLFHAIIGGSLEITTSTEYVGMVFCCQQSKRTSRVVKTWLASCCFFHTCAFVKQILGSFSMTTEDTHQIHMKALRSVLLNESQQFSFLSRKVPEVWTVLPVHCFNSHATMEIASTCFRNISDPHLQSRF